MKLPPRTVERLSKYRRLLERYRGLEGTHIYSHKLAGLLNLNPEQVRRDLMLIGMIGNTIGRQEGQDVVAANTTSLLLQSGIRGLLNFTSVHHVVPSDIYLKDYDIITSHEEIGFFIQD